MRAVYMIGFVLALIASPAMADEQRDAAARTAIVARIVDEVIVAGYSELAGAAGEESDAIAALCDAPSPETLGRARAAFAGTVSAWSRIELVRFGPARENYRFERIFYWPDRKGLGLRQVQALLAEQDESAAEVASLQQKSVAVQGLPALEFALFGSGSEALNKQGSFRCRYARAIAGAVAETAGELRDEWRDAGGYRALLLSPGPDNPAYKSVDEVLQALIQAAGEQLEVVRDLKIETAIEETPEKARPKRAPFWRSGQTIAALRGNIAGVEALFADRIDLLLGDDPNGIAGAFSFELSQADATLAELDARDTDWPSLAQSEDGHGKLAYVTIPLKGAINAVHDHYPQALGLVLGFNSLDGD